MVLTRSTGRVGVIVQQPHAVEPRYRVRFAGAADDWFDRSDMTVFKALQKHIPGAPEPGYLYRFVQYRCIVGSTAYGLDNEHSDIDRRGFYLPPASLSWSLPGVPEQLETDNEEVYWEIEKFIRLALKANPNILECLYSPMVETCTPIAAELLEMRAAFLSQHVYRTYSAYVLSQFKKLEQDQRNRAEIRWKHVMHLLRLLLSGVAVLRSGLVPLDAGQYRDRLLAVRRGEITWPEVEKWRLALHRELDESLSMTKLPAEPDYERANQFLIKARRLATASEYEL